MYNHSSSSKSLQKKKHYLPAVVAVIVVLFCFNFGFNTFNQILSNNRQIKSNKNKISQLQDRLERVEALRGGELTEIEAVVMDALPDEKPVFRSLQVVNAMAEDTSLALSNWEARPGSLATPSATLVQTRSSSSRNNRKFQAMPLEVSVNGEISSINNFLKDLLLVAPLMEMKTVRISTASRQASQGSEQPLFSSELELEVYWMPLSTETRASQAGGEVQELSSDQLGLVETLSGLKKY